MGACSDDDDDGSGIEAVCEKAVAANCGDMTKSECIESGNESRDSLQVHV